MAGRRSKGQRSNKRNAVSTLLLVLIASLAVLLAPSAGAVPAPEQLPAPQLGPELPLGDSQSQTGGEPSADKSAIIPGHYIVVLEDSVAHPGALAEAQTDQHDGELGFVYRHALKGYSAKLTKKEAEALRRDPRVKYVAPDRRVEAFSQTIPSGIARTYAPQNTVADIDEKEDAPVNADVAVIDTGIDQNHPDLNVYKRTNCVPPKGFEEDEVEKCVDGTGTDDFGHGTHVAGTIGAKDNGIGVVGMAPGVRLWSVKVLTPYFGGANGSDAWIVAGIDWVTAHASEIEVANMSLGCLCEDAPIDEAIDASVEAGVVYAVAAGNESTDAKYVTPAHDPNVITVAALADYDGKPGGEAAPLAATEPYCEHSAEEEWEHYGLDDTLARFSNWGEDVDVAAPGVCVYSTLPTEPHYALGEQLFPTYYGYLSGTSMASPHVAGAAALLASESNPNDKEDVEAIKQQIVEDGNLNWDDGNGFSANVDPHPLLGVGGPKETSVATGGTSGLNYETNSIVLHGAIQPRGLKTEYHFEYGLTTKYGTNVPATPGTVGAEADYTKVSETLSGLKRRTYHFRLVATNSSGTYYGADHTAYLSPWRPRAGSVDESQLNGVSCTSQDACVAVGNRYYDAETTQWTGLASRWDGEKWTQEDLPKSELSMPEAVSCSSSTDCMAVGWSNLTYPTHPLYSIHWDGSKWTPKEVPLPEKGYEDSAVEMLHSVSCASSTFCMAVGQTRIEDGIADTDRTLTETWNGSKWTVVPSPNKELPYGPEGILNSVSCASPSFCAAVGEANEQSVEGRGHFGPLAMTWNGTSWTMAKVTGYAEQGLGVRLTSISCPTSSDCKAGGYWGRDAYSRLEATGGVTDGWNGQQWGALQKIDAPVTSLSCAAASWCEAVGPSFGQRWSPESWGLQASHWNGSGWTLQPFQRPQVSHPRTHTSVSCPSAAGCVAVGSVFNIEEGEVVLYQATLAEHLEPTWPAASTEAAGKVTSNGAELRGTANPEGTATSYFFEYGTTEAYGSKTGGKSVGSGTGYVEVGEAIGGLQPATVYHFRLVATNEVGATYGADKTLTTADTTKTTLCTKDEAACAEANRYPAKTSFTATAESPGVTIATSAGNVTCAESTLAGETSAEAATPLPLKITAWSLGNCARKKVFSGTEACTASTPTLPESASLGWTEGSKGALPLASGLGWSIKCGSFIDCTMTFAPTATLSGGSPGQVTIPETAMTVVSGSACPETKTFKAATYSVSAPKPVYVKPATATTTLCKASSEGSFCAEANRYPAKTSFTATAESPGVTIATSAGNVTCAESTLAGETSAEAATPLPLKITAWSLGNCARKKVFSGTEACTASTPTLPESASLGWTEGSKGALPLASGLGWSIKCGSFIDCTMTFAPTATLSGGSPGQVTIPETAMTVVSGSACPETKTFKAATYSVSAPKPVYVKLRPY